MTNLFPLRYTHTNIPDSSHHTCSMLPNIKALQLYTFLILDLRGIPNLRWYCILAGCVFLKKIFSRSAKWAYQITLSVRPSVSVIIVNRMSDTNRFQEQFLIHFQMSSIPINCILPHWLNHSLVVFRLPGRGGGSTTRFPHLDRGCCTPKLDFSPPPWGGLPYKNNAKLPIYIGVLYHKI